MTDELVIRPFADDDEVAVLKLWQRTFASMPAHDPAEAAIARKRAHDDELFLVATVGDRIVATTMAGYDGHRGWLYLVAVDPDCRRRGIGRQIVRAAEQRLHALGCPKVNLQVRADNAAVAAFYEALGYAVEPRVSMGKVLRRS